MEHASSQRRGPAGWSLDRGLTFLNHGSYGACPHEAIAYQDELRRRVELDPVRFYKVDLERMLDGLRERLGELINCPARDVAPMPNATIALCTILWHEATTRLQPGDEILVTDHEYTSGLNELERIQRCTGVRVVTARVPYPSNGPDQVLDAIDAAVTPRTRLALVSHVTTTTALIFPIQRIVDRLRERGIDTIVDGAHAPGQTHADVRSLDPAYYVGSGHKWLSSPKGTGFAYVRRDRQEGLRPLALSSRAAAVRPERPLFLRDFDYMGTLDYSNLLTLPASMDALTHGFADGWDGLYRQNHEMVCRARAMVCDHLNLRPPAPESMVPSMASIILPNRPAGDTRTTLYDDPLQDALLERHRIVVPVWPWGANDEYRVLRISAQLYNTPDQYERLASALAEELEREQADQPEPVVATASARCA